jgi:threonine synthase
MENVAFQKCIDANCAATYSVDEALQRCPACGNLLDVEYDWDKLVVPGALSYFERRRGGFESALDFSGVWRFRELIPFAPEDSILTIGEGQTLLRESPPVAKYCGLKEDALFLQYEGLNPSGSFKDNGMTAAFTHGNMVGAKVAACASTGNTSASLALYAAATGRMKALVFVGSGKIAYGKLAQALEYGAKTLQIDGDFDDAMRRVQEVCAEKGLYLVNSLNPFRLEGQKAIMYRVLEGLRWEVPDWVVVPGGNLGNSSAFGKAFIELEKLGLIERKPRIAIINSTGAQTLYQLVEEKGLTWNGGVVDDAIIDEYYAHLDKENIRAKTVASAIEINRPVNLKKALRAIEATGGLVRAVRDDEILDAKAQIGAGALGCEPASAASVAGVRTLLKEGIISKDERVVCILTGHMLKDPNIVVNYHSLSTKDFAESYKGYGMKSNRFSNQPIQVKNDLDEIFKAIER